VTDLLQRLKVANQNLSQLIQLLLPSDSPREPIGPDHLAVVLTEILTVGEWLQNGRVPGDDVGLAAAIRQYRNHLERLRGLLPSLHADLLTERARLESERSHLEAATAWTGASRSTT
jgi:hypothetical protein